MADPEIDFVTIARVVKTQGRHGEVAVNLHTDFPERFAERRRLFASFADGTRKELQLESYWPHLGRYVLKFTGVDSMDMAEELVGCELQIPKHERVPLDAGSAYVSDLVGCEVWVVKASNGKDELIGKIADVQFGAGEAPLLIIRSAEKEHLVPYAAEYILAVELDRKRLRMRLPEGMLELDKPLTDEEKQRQQRK